MPKFTNRHVVRTGGHRITTIIACIVLIGLTLPPARSTIHEVIPGDCIQDTVNSASPGDTILMFDGDYEATVVLYGKSLTIGSLFLLDGDTTHIGATVIAPDALRPDTGSCFVYAYQEPPLNRLVGLTLTNGTGTYWTQAQDFAGGAVFVMRTWLEMLHCQVRSSGATYGGGVFVYGDHSLRDAGAVIRDCRIADCTSFGWGGGIYANHCSLRVANTALENDASVAVSGGGISSLDAYTEIDSCIFRACSGVVGGIEIGGGGYVANCLFEDNIATGLHWASDLALNQSSYVAFNNTFHHNQSLTRAIQFCCEPDDYVSFFHNIVEGVVVGTNPSGVVWLSGISLDVGYNQFLNSGGDGGRAGIFYSFQGANGRVHHNWFEGNFASDSVGSVFYTGPNSNTTLDSNVIAGNFGQTFSLLDYLDMNVIDARNNWWGDASGPYHPTLNPTGQGDTLLSDSVLFIPWLTEPPDTTMPPNAARAPRAELPQSPQLLDAYPNPFNSTLNISWTGISGPSFELTLHDLLGRTVDVIHRGPIGGSRITYSARAELASGVYFIRATSGITAQSHKVIFLK